MEQFHSEIKSELDLERLPSGKFATNSLVLHLGMLAYNLLRLSGQESLNAATQPLRKKVKRRFRLNRRHSKFIRPFEPTSRI